MDEFEVVEVVGYCGWGCCGTMLTAAVRTGP